MPLIQFFSTEVFMPFYCMLIYLAVYKRRRAAAWRPLFIYCCATFLVVFYATWRAVHQQHNILFYSVLALLDVLFASFYILKPVTGPKFVTYYIYWAAGITACWLVTAILFNTLNKFSDLTIATGAAIVLGISLYYIISLVRSKEVIIFFKLHYFWVSSGFFFYALLTCTVMVLLQFEYHSDLLFLGYYTAPVVKYTFISIAFLTSKKTVTYT